MDAVGSLVTGAATSIAATAAAAAASGAGDYIERATSSASSQLRYLSTMDYAVNATIHITDAIGVTDGIYDVVYVIADSSGIECRLILGIIFIEFLEYECSTSIGDDDAS